MGLKVSILGSGSRGNSALVTTSRVRVLVDAGFSFRQLSKRMAEIGEAAESLDAVLISHEHSDHISGLQVLSRKVPVPIFMTGRTDAAIDWDEKAKPHVETFEAGAKLAIGDLDIETFTIPHDAVDPVGFTFRQNGFKVGIATDIGYMTESIKRHIRGCDMLVLESNHDLEMLKVGPYPWFVKQRVMSRVGHLSNQAVSDYLTEELDRETQVLVLAHLSGHNNHPEIARMFADQALQRAGATATRLLVAAQDRPSEVFEF